MLQTRLSIKPDVPALVDIWRRSVRATHHFLSEADFREIEEIVAVKYLPNVEVWVAADGDGPPLGFMGLTGDNVDALFIDPDVRGRGIGKMLLAHADSICGALTVDVNEQNEQAVGFYRRMGFVETGRSALDGDGRPYPLLHMRRPKQHGAA